MSIIDDMWNELKVQELKWGLIIKLKKIWRKKMILGQTSNQDGHQVNLFKKIQFMCSQQSIACLFEKMCLWLNMNEEELPFRFMKKDSRNHLIQAILGDPIILHGVTMMSDLQEVGLVAEEEAEEALEAVIE